LADVVSRLKEGLTKTRVGLMSRLQQLVNRKALDEEFFEELEDALIQADMGIDTVLEIIDKVRQEASRGKINDSEGIFWLIQKKIEKILKQSNGKVQLNANGPTVIMIVGVNGVGKTTSIAKLAHRFKLEGQKVLLAAADTFRAAAADQLEMWAQRIGIQVIKHQEGADPAAVAFDALRAAQSRSADILIVDTAGRFQNKKNLMEEVKKIKRTIKKELPGAPHEILLVLDATMGQNAISQARVFNEALDVTGIILAKLDGTAKGGIVVSIARELGIPVKFVGIGEKVDDLQEFNAEEFAAALFDTRGRKRK